MTDIGRLFRRTGLLFALASALCTFSAHTATAQAEAEDEAFLEDLSARTFQWFWETTNAANGLAPDRGPPPSFASVAAVGFALTAYPVGVERGYITRAQAVERVLATLQFFHDAPQGPEPAGRTGYKGFFYHFLDLEAGTRIGTVELSTIDTAWFVAGALFCQSYFDGPNEDETRIRELAETIYRRVQWDWAFVRPPLISMGWHPETGFIGHDYRGYDEAMGLYVLALGSPTHAVDQAAWAGFTASYRWADFHGQEHVNFSPLFGHQYTACWIDLRGIQDATMRDRGIDYFENSRRATYSQRAYAIANPGGWKDYGADIWGLTACDGPADVTLTVDGRTLQFRTYAARGASAGYILDDGTIAPTAAGGSMPFAPEIVIPALRAMRDRYGDAIYTAHGFLDAFNPTFTFTDVPLHHGRIVPGLGWFDTQHLGIDQGPILLMLENHRSGLVWKVMQRNPHIVRGLKRAGFTGGWLEALPQITEPPANAAADAGGSFTLGADASGAGPFTWQWFKDGVAIDGADDQTFTVASASVEDTGTYRVRVTGANGFTDSTDAVVAVHAEAARLVNLSTRGHAGTGDEVLISGCVVVGTRPQRTLIRAVGPTLVEFGLDPSVLLGDPRLTVHGLDGAPFDGNDDWGAQPGATEVLAAMNATGAFELPADSVDAALLADLSPGQPTTTIVRGAPAGGEGGDDGVGIALAEIYALDDALDPRLANLSTRGFVGTGPATLILGFYLSPGGTRRVLIRGVGPGLEAVAPDLQPLLPDPVVVVRRASDGVEVARNDDWEGDGNGAEISAAGAQVWAFALAAGSHDAALILSVPPAVPGGEDRGFTAQVIDSTAQTGIALVEVYELPPI